MRGPSIDDDPAGPGRPGLHVGFQAVAGGDRGDENAFSFPETDGFHQIRRDLDAAFIIDVAVGDHGTVELGLEDLTEHGGGREAVAPSAVKPATDGIPTPQSGPFAKCKCFASPSGPLRA